MKLGWIGPLALLTTLCFLADTAWTQRSRRHSYGSQSGSDQSDQGGYSEPEDVKLPDDPKLLDIHRGFVEGAEKLAADYIKTGQLDKARACYEEVVRLVPSYTKGREHLASVKDMQAKAEKKTLSVMANEDWQDSGVTVQEGKPVIITATGLWNFRISADLEADGMEIPRDLRDFNLGALVGMVEDGNPKGNKPFFVGSHLEFTPTHTGRLLLRMYDGDVSDNTGKLQVEVTGMFGTGSSGKRQAISGSNETAP